MSFAVSPVSTLHLMPVGRDALRGRLARGRTTRRNVAAIHTRTCTLNQHHLRHPLPVAGSRIASPPL